MMTVQEVAERYGVSADFIVRALARVGYHAAKPDQPLSAATVARFEAEWGDRIRAARPAPEPAAAAAAAFTGETDIAPTAVPTRHVPGHVMRVAHAKVGAGRDSSGNKVKRLMEDPGAVHAIDAAGTNEGDPWRGKVESGAVHFFGGAMNSGPTAACGWAHMRAVLGDEFVPADDPNRANQCPRCAAVVADGKGFRDPPHEREYRSYFCLIFLRVRIDGVVTVKNCSLRDVHDGPHRARDGAEWDVGVDDYVPSPNEVGCAVTNAS